MKNRYVYAFLICLALCIASARALSDSDYQIRSLENFDLYLYHGSLLIGLDSTDYNYVALEPYGSAVNGTNCYLWTAQEYGGHLYFLCQENGTAILHETVDSVRVNGVPYSEGDLITFIAGVGQDIEWSYTLAPMINLDLGLGIFGLLLCFICPIGIIKALREHDVDRATLVYFIGLCLGVAFLWGWLFA